MTQLVLLRSIKQELDDRLKLFRSLPDGGSSKTAEPNLLRDLGIYGGASGIWLDKERTSRITRWV